MAAPGPPVVQDFSGRWTMVETPQSKRQMKVFMEEMGLGRILRAILRAWFVPKKIKVSQTPTTMTLESSGLGGQTIDFPLDGHVHVSTDSNGKKRWHTAQQLAMGDLLVRREVPEGFVFVTQWHLDTRVRLTRRIELFKPAGGATAGADTDGRPKFDDLDSAAVLELAYTKQETEEERIANEEAEEAAAASVGRQLVELGLLSPAERRPPSAGGAEDGAGAGAGAGAGPAAADAPAFNAAAMTLDPANDLTGVWAVDDNASDSLEPMMKALGLPWAARKIALSLKFTVSIVHTASELHFVSKCRMFAHPTDLLLDGLVRQTVNDKGAIVLQRAWQNVPGFTPPAALPPAEPPVADVVKLAGTLCITTELPDGKGRIFEARRRAGDGFEVYTQYFAPSDDASAAAPGVVKACVRQVYHRLADDDTNAVAITATGASSNAQLATDVEPCVAEVMDAAKRRDEARARAGDAPPVTAADIERTHLPRALLSQFQDRRANLSGRWVPDAAHVAQLEALLGAAKLPVVPAPTGRGATAVVSIVQTHTQLTVDGPSALLAPDTAVLTDGRPHQCRLATSGKLAAAVSCTVESDDVVLHVVYGAPPPRFTDATTVNTGFRVMDLWCVVSRTCLRRVVTVIKNGSAVGVAHVEMHRQESEDERAAALAVEQIAAQRKQTVEERSAHEARLRQVAADRVRWERDTETTAAKRLRRNDRLRAPCMASGLGMAGGGCVALWQSPAAGVVLVAAFLVLMLWLVLAWAPGVPDPRPPLTMDSLKAAPPPHKPKND